MLSFRSRRFSTRSRMQGLSGRLAFLVLTACLWSHEALSQPTPSGTGFEGRWYTADKSIVELKPCPAAAELCGYIAWARVGGTDEANPTAEQRKRPICGLQILELRHFDGTMWKDGWVYDPGDGQTNRAVLRKRDDKLFLRGFIGTEMFGETETWSPVTDTVQTCKP
ncbi:Uncharacterized conserved protein, DUF2147 family [Burkholderia sp. GAS332]|nr:Uncharacterized conserved protein, DUF2147 family [Burkholderia sp. GAS332]